MTDETHDEPGIPEEAVEDLAPTEDEQDVSGGDVYLHGPQGELDDKF